MRTRIALLVIALLGEAALGAQDRTLPPTFESRVDLVSVTVTVESHDGSFKTDLGPADFRVLENGVPQTIAFFAYDSVPVDLVLLIDGSGSMNSRLGTVRHAASAFIESL